MRFPILVRWHLCKPTLWSLLWSETACVSCVLPSCQRTAWRQRRARDVGPHRRFHRGAPRSCWSSGWWIGPGSLCSEVWGLETSPGTWGQCPVGRGYCHLESWENNKHQADGLVQDCSSPSALAMELLQSCNKPSKWCCVLNVWCQLCTTRGDVC